jgi:hypothetical protein
MESKKLIRIGMKLTEAIVEILKDELSDDKKVRRTNEIGQKKNKAIRKRSSKNSGRSYGFSRD